MTPDLVAILIAIVVGTGIVLRIDGDARGTRVGGESILFGFAVCAAVLFLFAVVGVRWSRGPILAVVAAIAIASFVAFAFRTRPVVDEIAVSGSRVLAGVLDALTIVILAGYAFFATVAAPAEFDYLVNFGLKAKTFWIVRGIDWGFLEHAVNRLSHPDYPLLLPLTFDWFTVVRGAWSDATLGLVNVACAVAVLLIVRRLALEETGSRCAAAFITFALTPIVAMPWIGTAEGPFIAYATAGLLLIRRGSLPAGALLLGLAASTKNEGLTLLVFAAVALLIDRRPRDVVRLWPAAAVILPWLVIRSMFGFPTDLATGGVVSRVFERLHNPMFLVSQVAHNGFDKPYYWVALVIGAIVVASSLFRNERFVLVTIALQFGIYMLALLAMPYDLSTTRWAVGRLMAHLAPPLGFVVLVQLIAYAAGSTSGLRRMSKNSSAMPTQIAESATLNAGQ